MSRGLGKVQQQILKALEGREAKYPDSWNFLTDLIYKVYYTLEESAKAAGVRKQKALEWTKAIREEEERQQNEKIFYAWLACKTEEEIAETVGLTQKTVNNKIEALLEKKFPGTKAYESADFKLEIDTLSNEVPDESGWKRPIYNVCTRPGRPR